jgi:hypothetical protein
MGRHLLRGHGSSSSGNIIIIQASGRLDRCNGLGSKRPLEELRKVLRNLTNLFARPGQLQLPDQPASGALRDRDGHLLGRLPGAPARYLRKGGTNATPATVLLWCRQGRAWRGREHGSKKKAGVFKLITSIRPRCFRPRSRGKLYGLDSVHNAVNMALLGRPISGLQILNWCRVPS